MIKDKCQKSKENKNIILNNTHFIFCHLPACAGRNFDIQLAFDIGTLTLFGYWLLDIPKWIDLFFRVSVQQ